MPANFVELDEIERTAPEMPGYGGGKWAIYSAGCCWWTTVSYAPAKSSFGLPSCPHCGSVLYQAPLGDFLAAARGAPEHYGSGGLMTLAAAHSINARTCHREWEEYEEGKP